MSLHDKEMREVYADTLIELMTENPNVVCLEADLGKSTGTVPKVRDCFPERFLDIGVAEANMIGISAGLANDGLIPFCATFSGFASRRVYDQATISVAYANNAVRIIGTAPGVTTTKNGATHMCFQDLAIMRIIPNMRVYCPADVYELRSTIKYMVANDQPAYMQLIRIKMPKLFDEAYQFDPKRAVVLSEGTDVTIVTTGLTTSIVHEAIPELAKEGLSVDHVHCPSVKPLDVNTIVKSAKKTNAVITVENQSVIGGLGGAVSEALAENYPVRVKRLGAQDRFGEVGTQDYLIDTLGIGVKNIVKTCQEMTRFKN